MQRKFLDLNFMESTEIFVLQYSLGGNAYSVHVSTEYYSFHLININGPKSITITSRMSLKIPILSAALNTCRVK